MEERARLLEALSRIPPGALTYQDWCAVGMALKKEGFGPEVWENWSRGDSSRYHPGECRKNLQ